MSGPIAPPRQGMLQGTAAVLLAESTALPAGLVIVAVLTRRLGPVAYGQFAVAATLVTTLEWILIAIFSRAVVKFVAESSDWSPVAATAFRAYVVSGIAVGAALWMFAGRIAAILNDSLLAGHLRLFALEIPIFAAAAACRQVLAGLASYRQQAAASAGRWLGRVTLIVLFVQLGWAVKGAILGSIGGALVAWTLGQVFVGRSVWDRAEFPIRRLLQLAVPAFLLMLGVRLFDRLGLLALKALGGGGAQVGFYGAAQNLLMVAGIVAMSVSPILISTLSAAIRDGSEAHARELAEGALRFGFALLPFAGIVAGASGEVVELLFGPTFAEAAPLAAWLSIGAAELIIISLATAVLIAIERPWPAVVLTAPLLPLSLVGHVLLIPRLGAIGAALVTSATAAVGATACVTILTRIWRLRPPLGTLCRSVVLAVAAHQLASAWHTPGLLLIFKAAVLSAAVIGAFVLLRELSRAELAKIGALLVIRGQRKSARG